jgi:hypothetical protein
MDERNWAWALKIIFYCNGKNMEIAIFSAFWQKPPKAKENLEKCRENKPCAIYLYGIICSNSAGNLGNGRKKLGLGAMKS